jgi:hypothetical protein
VVTRKRAQLEPDAPTMEAGLDALVMQFAAILRELGARRRARSESIQSASGKREPWGQGTRLDARHEAGRAPGGGGGVNVAAWVAPSGRLVSGGVRQLGGKLGLRTTRISGNRPPEFPESAQARTPCVWAPVTREV